AWRSWLGPTRCLVSRLRDNALRRRVWRRLAIRSGGCNRRDLKGPVFGLTDLEVDAVANADSLRQARRGEFEAHRHRTPLQRCDRAVGDGDLLLADALDLALATMRCIRAVRRC